LHRRCCNRDAKAQHKRKRHRLNQSAGGAASTKEVGEAWHSSYCKSSILRRAYKAT
jgi:hypothetical protein